MAVMFTRVQVDDYEAWKPMFDSDPAGARHEAKSHRILRTVDDPNSLLVQVEFESVEAARAARERVVSSGVLERQRSHDGPTIAEVADTVTY